MLGWNAPGRERVGMDVQEGRELGRLGLAKGPKEGPQHLNPSTGRPKDLYRWRLRESKAHPAPARFGAGGRGLGRGPAPKSGSECASLRAAAGV